MCDISKIPTDEEFVRASRLMKESFRNLDMVREEVLRHFKGRCQLHNIWILPQMDVDFRAYVFFKKDEDVKASKSNGVQEEIIEYVYSGLERAGRGKRNAIKVAFEFDSDENIKVKFNGNYDHRLR